MNLPKSMLAAIPAGARIQVRHFNDKNSTDWDREGCKWITVARIVKITGDVVEVLAEGRAYCNPKDMPCRKTGRIRAIGRAINNLTHGVTGKSIGFPWDYTPTDLYKTICRRLSSWSNSQKDV